MLQQTIIGIAPLNSDAILRTITHLLTDIWIPLNLYFYFDNPVVNGRPRLQAHLKRIDTY